MAILSFESVPSMIILGYFVQLEYRIKKIIINFNKHDKQLPETYYPISTKHSLTGFWGFGVLGFWGCEFLGVENFWGL